jgi:hypothetical protein
MPALEIIHPGLHTTVQDHGRDGFRDSGIPASGPLDRISLRFANTLVGNSAATPARNAAHRPDGQSGFRLCTHRYCGLQRRYPS